MTEIEKLHGHVRAAWQSFSGSAESNALRALFESGSVERLLSDLLFIRLHSCGLSVSREFSLETRGFSDLTVHRQPELHLELKQLHLKDVCSVAACNLVRDLRRHTKCLAMGILFVADERCSKTQINKPRFGGANRRAGHDVHYVLEQLPNYFLKVFPTSPAAALVRTFEGHGRVDLYAFIVADPVPESCTKSAC